MCAGDIVGLRRVKPVLKKLRLRGEEISSWVCSGVVLEPPRSWKLETSVSLT